MTIKRFRYFLNDGAGLSENFNDPRGGVYRLDHDTGDWVARYRCIPGFTIRVGKHFKDWKPPAIYSKKELECREANVIVKRWWDDHPKLNAMQINELRALVKTYYGQHWLILEDFANV